MKDLIVHADSSAHGSTRAEFAARLAQTLQARLVGVYAQSATAMPFGDESLGGIEAEAVTAPEGAEYVAQLARADAQAAEKAFRAQITAHSTTAQWRAMVGSVADVLVAYARYADLVIVGQRSPGGDDIAAELALRAGRPVLVVPSEGRCRTPVARVLVAWDASREATRALHDALPLLRGAGHVMLLSAGPAEKLPPGADIAEHLRLHGIKATVAQQTAADGDAGSMVLACAEQQACDLIVMGAYGHSRLRERVLGGTTRQVLEGMTVPVLVAH